MATEADVKKRQFKRTNTEQGYVGQILQQESNAGSPELSPRSPSSDDEEKNADIWANASGIKLRSNDYYPFTPVDFLKMKNLFDDDERDDDDENEYNISELIRKTNKNQLKARLIRVISLLMIPIVLFPLIHLGDKKFSDPVNNPSTYDPAKQRAFGLMALFGYGALFTFIAYFIHLFSMFFYVLNKNKKVNRALAKQKMSQEQKQKRFYNLFRVYSLNSIVPNWRAKMGICYETIILENQAICSISEFSAIAGGVAQAMLLLLSVTSWAVVISATAFEIQRSEYKVAGVGMFCECTGCFGLVLIGTYELDPFNKIMILLHYIGAGLGVFTVVGYFYQQLRFAIHDDEYVSYLWLPSLLSIIAGICFVAWQWYGIKAKRFAESVSLQRNKSNGNGDSDSAAGDGSEQKQIDKSESIAHTASMLNKQITDEKIKKEVTKLSLQNVISEAIFLFCGALSMCLYIIDMEKCFTDLRRNCY